MLFTSQGPDEQGPSLDLKATWVPSESRIELEVLRGGGPTSIAIATDERVVGGAYYFICPVTAERCLKLYYSQGSWGGRKAKQLVYSSQRRPRTARYTSRLRRLTGALIQVPAEGPESEAERAAVERRLRRLRAKIESAATGRADGSGGQAEPQDFSDLVDMFSPSQSRGGFQQPRVMREVALGAEMAIERARDLSLENDDGVEWLYRRCDAFREAALSPRRRTPVELAHAPVEGAWNFPRFSLRTLAALGYVKPGARRGVKLDWSGVDTHLGRVNLVIDLRDEDVLFTGFELFDQRGVTYQAVRLGRTARGFSFVCPFSGAKTDTLVYREGWLGSAGALRLNRY